MIEFVCPSCQSGLRVGDDTGGQVVRCGSCLATVRVPDAPPTPSPPRNPDLPRPTAVPLDRPRPLRRRSPPPQKSSRSAAFWVLIVLLVVGLIGAGVCGGIVVMLQPKWRTHESPRGGFKVDLPGPPRSDMRELAMNNDPDFEIEGTILVFQGEGYGVMYRDIDPWVRRTRTDDRLMDEVLNGIKRDEPGIIVRQTKPLTISGFAARELVLSHPDEGLSIWRIVVADTRLYLVFAGGQNTDPETNPRIRRFLDSFAVTDPLLLTKAGKRVPPPPDPEPDEEPDTETPAGIARNGLLGARDVVTP